MVMLIARTVLSSASSSSTHKNYRETSLTVNPNNRISIKPSPKPPFASPIPHLSTTSTNLSASITKENSNHNAQIIRLCELGNLQAAMELLNQSPKTKLHSKAYSSISQLCAELKSLKHGKKLHSIISSNGSPIEGALAAKLVFMYVTCGDLDRARWVFEKAPKEKVFLWNLMMNEYAKIGDYRESIDLFQKMMEVGVGLNLHSFSCVLKCFGALRSVEEGEEVHGCVLKLGFGGCNSVVNSLIAFYFKVGRVESARKVFDELSDRDVISWNSMISGYVANALPSDGLLVFEEMMSSGIEVDLATVIGVLMGCASSGDHGLGLGRVVHGLAGKLGYESAITLRNTLLDMYSKCGDLDNSIRVFEKMGKRSVVSWTSMIAGYVREGQASGAIALFHEMEKEGVRPDVYTVTSVLHACACNGLVENGRDVHSYIRDNDMQSSVSVCNALMDMYAKCGGMEDAHSVFSEMKVKDMISWNTMMGGYSKNSLPNEALGLFVDMQRELRPDSVTLACVLPACASLSALERGREIHCYAMRKGFSSGRHVANALVDMYAKCGAFALARGLFDVIPVKDLVSWTVMIAGYGMHGLGNEAIAMFDEMRRAGIEPDGVSFVSILYACSHSGLVDEGRRFFDSMRNEYNIEPEAEHYACLVDLLARKGNLDEAYKFIQGMPIAPDATVWGSLLCGCRIHHDVELAEKVAERIFQLEPDNIGYYVLLANIYAEAERWEEVKRMRERIGRLGLKKQPGCSWIEVKGKVHLFVAGTSNRSSQQTEQIQSFLTKLRTRMKEDGYVPRTKYALIRADEAEREAALCGHSEKQAMAFGVLSLPFAKVIRVTKNLRVCGDCHETAKFMSKMVGKDILLRDSNRFHRFEDGSCSCRGFW